MRKLEPILLRPWVLPLIVLAVAVPIVAAFILGGPPAGLAAGAIAATVILVLAARARFDEPIEVGAAPGDRFMLLVVLVAPLEDPSLAGALAEIALAGAAATGAGSTPEVLALAPALNTRLAHWLSDLRGARFDAQRRLALSLASLAGTDVDARGQVGDSDPVQAVEDTLRTFPAQEVVFVTDPDGAAAVEEVRRRLDRPVRVLQRTPSRSHRERSAP
ncbi:MAG TPA: hypothetical protein VKG89_06115 [Solirubrobacterales bacterium]|nr:hypothetical protein [Solirubrobacterales bacterium]